MTLTDYSKLRKQVILSVGASERHSQLLSTLKELFRDDINSPRRFEQINSIGQLLKVLEIRDVLSENDIRPLKEIARILPDNNDLMQRISDYESSHVPVDFTNFYAYENTPTIQNRQTGGHSLSVNNNNYNNNTGMSEKKKQRIIDTVTDDIGTFWKDLARSLDIKEKQIDEINVNYKTIPLKAKCVLGIHKDISDDQSWFYELCEGLETSRRRDLSRKIKKISLLNI